MSQTGQKKSANTNGTLIGYGFAEATYASYNGETATSQTIAGDIIGVTLTPESYPFSA